MKLNITLGVNNEATLRMNNLRLQKIRALQKYRHKLFVSVEFVCSSRHVTKQVAVNCGNHNCGTVATHFVDGFFFRNTALQFRALYILAKEQ